LPFFPVVQISGARTGMIELIRSGLTNPEKQIVIGKEVEKGEVSVKK